LALSIAGRVAKVRTFRAIPTSNSARNAHFFKDECLRTYFAAGEVISRQNRSRPEIDDLAAAIGEILCASPGARQSCKGAEMA
jgi:hypothetical protein